MKLVNKIRGTLGMKIVVYSTPEFLAMFDNQGVPIYPFSIAANSIFNEWRAGGDGLSKITSLEGVTIGDGVEIYGLNSITSLDGVEFGLGIELYGLINLKSTNGIPLMALQGLADIESVVVEPINPSEAELDLLRRIPLDQLAMGAWHCGTSHCLAGWAQVLSDIEANNATVFADGCRVLPSMAPYFFCSDAQVLRYLKTLHK